MPSTPSRKQIDSVVSTGEYPARLRLVPAPALTESQPRRARPARCAA